MIATSTTTQSLVLFQSLRFAFRDAGTSLLRADLDSYQSTMSEARQRIAGLLEGVSPSVSQSEHLVYPLRATQRFVAGESYGPARFFALERNFLARAGYLKGLRDSETPIDNLLCIEAPPSERTIPSPPLTRPVSRPPSFEECRDMIERAAVPMTALPAELGFTDLIRGELRELQEENRSHASQVIDLPMKVVLERIFSRTFDIGENRGDIPQFWVEGVKLTPSTNGPSVRISCDLASTDDLRGFVIAIQALLNIPNPIEIVLEGKFDWRDGALYIPLTPVGLLGGVIPAAAVFGTVTPILVPIAEDRTVLAITMENKMLSRNPGVFVKRMASGVK